VRLCHRLPARERRRVLQPGRSVNPAGRWQGSQNPATLAAALARRAGEAALAGDMSSLAAVGNDGARVRRDHAERGGNYRRVYQTFVRAADTAREKVARGNPLQISTAGDDVGSDGWLAIFARLAP
jgi:hypothetical protein